MSEPRFRCVKVFGHPETKKLLDEAFKGLKDEELSPVWFTEDECFSVKQKEKNTYYMFDVFEGDAFEHITSLGCRVLGPLCILTSLTCKTDIPRRSEPVYNLAMKGVVVCCTNIDKEQREPIHHKVLLMGGDVSRDLTEDVTHLVAAAVGSNKYLFAAGSGRQVMVPKWIDAVWEKSKLEAVHGLDEQFQEYKCPVFLGLVITVSGLHTEERKEVKRLVEKEGGKYSGELKLQDCTHLITNEPKGQKYMFARKWDISIVRSEWLYDSIEKGYCRDDKEYRTGGTAEENKGQMKTSTPERRSLATNITDISNISMISMAHVNETAASNVTNMNDTTRMEEGDAIDKLDISKAPVDLFLDGCKIYLSGFQGSTLEKLRKIINSGGGTRSNQISDNLTHVVIGDKILADIEQIKNLSTHPHGVTSQWLVDGFKQGRLLPENDYRSSELPAPAPTTPKAKPTGLKKKPRPSSTASDKISASRQSIKPSSTTGEGEHEDEMEDILSQYMDNPQPASASNDITVAPPGDEDVTLDPADLTEAGEGGVFSKKTFVFYGFEEDQIPTFSSFIKENGGTMLQMNARRIPDYAVVPMNGYPIDRTVGDIVTNAWLQICIERSSLQDLSTNPLFTPIEINIDSQPLQDCVLSISGYQGTERDCLSHIAEALGATIQEYFVRDATKNGLIPNTHLLVNAPEGSKFKAARKWGLPAVSNTWLLDCARLGKLLPVEEYDIEKVHGGHQPVTLATGSAAEAAKPSSAVSTGQTEARTPVGVQLAEEQDAANDGGDKRRSSERSRNSTSDNFKVKDTDMNKSKRDSGARRSEETAVSLPDFSTTGDTEALLLEVRSQEDSNATVQGQDKGQQSRSESADGDEDEDEDDEIQFNPQVNVPDEITPKGAERGDNMSSKGHKLAEDEEEVTFRGQRSARRSKDKDVSSTGDSTSDNCDNVKSNTARTEDNVGSNRVGQASAAPKYLSKTDKLKHKENVETPPLNRYMKKLEAGDKMVSGSPLLTTTSIRDKLLAKDPIKYNWRAEEHGAKQPSLSQKENLVAMKTPVQSRVKELRKTQGRADDKDTPSKFLNPDVRYLPKFDTAELMKAFETPEDVRASRAKRRSSLPLDELFEMKMAEAQETIQRAKERKLQDGLPSGSQYDEVDGDEDSESDVLKGVVITVAKKLVKDQAELNDLVVSLGGDYRWNYDSSCTHLIFQGRQNDTAKDFRLARTHNLKIVSPHWLYMCKEQNAHVDESLFPHTFNPNLSLQSVVSTRRTPMRTPGRASRRNMRLNSKSDGASAHSSDTDTKSTSDSKPSGGQDDSKEKEDGEKAEEDNDPPVAMAEEMETGGSLEMREVLSRQLEDVMAESKGKLRRRSKKLNSSGQVSTPEDTSSSGRQSGRIKGSVEKPMSRNSRNFSPGSSGAAKDEKSSGDIGPSQSVHVVWDDPMGRMEQEKLAAMLERANSPTQEVDDFQDNIPPDAQYSDIEPDHEEVPMPPFQEQPTEKTPKPSKQSAKKTPTPEGPSIAFPTSDKAMKITPPRPLLVSEAVNEIRSPPIFMVSAMTQPEKDDYGALIEQLGGQLLDTPDFDPRCTHLVVGSINRNEKFLASIASGKWVLHKSYLEACRQEQKFVNEDFYEWGSEGTLSLVKNMDSNVRLLAAAARDWRIKVQQERQSGSDKVGAFCSWRVLLCADKNKEGNYRRLLEAGGATIINLKPPFTNKVDATHVFLELHKVSLSQDDLEMFVTSGCVCLKPSYICTYLSDPSSDTTNHIIPEVAALTAVLSGENSASGKKRKASTGDAAPKRSKRR